MVSKDEPKKIERGVSEGGNVYVCTHFSHEDGHLEFVGNHEKYQEHLKSHNKRELGAKLCARCEKNEVDLNAHPNEIGAKAYCDDCTMAIYETLKKEGRIP